MLKILLPLLLLFSMSSFAVMPVEAGYAAPDYVVTDSVINQQPCVAETEPFERMYVVTGAATQYKETTYTLSGLSLKSVGLPNEVGWRNLT